MPVSDTDTDTGTGTGRPSRREQPDLPNFLINYDLILWCSGVTELLHRKSALYLLEPASALPVPCTADPRSRWELHKRRPLTASDFGLLAIVHNQGSRSRYLSGVAAFEGILWFRLAGSRKKLTQPLASQAPAQRSLLLAGRWRSRGDAACRTTPRTPDLG